MAFLVVTELDAFIRDDYNSLTSDIFQIVLARNGGLPACIIDWPD